MFCDMERNADSMAIRFAHRNFNIHFLAFDGFAKFP